MNGTVHSNGSVGKWIPGCPPLPRLHYLSSIVVVIVVDLPQKSGARKCLFVRGLKNASGRKREEKKMPMKISVESRLKLSTRDASRSRRRPGRWTARPRDCGSRFITFRMLSSRYGWYIIVAW
eukprot:scaffold19245_cov199-Amphora_coffeaeformis.AAC.33